MAQCREGQPALTSYSVATGKLEHVLYRYQATCQFYARGCVELSTVLWGPDVKR